MVTVPELENDILVLEFTENSGWKSFLNKTNKSISKIYQFSSLHTHNLVSVIELMPE